MPGAKPTAAQLKVRAELEAIDHRYDTNEPPPHEQMRILIEIDRLQAARRQYYKSGGTGKGDKHQMRGRTKFGTFKK